MVTYNSCYSKIIPDLQCPQEVGQKQECECNFSVLVGHPHCKTTTATKALSHGMRSATWIAQPYLTPTKTQSSKIPLFTTKCSYQHTRHGGPSFEGHVWRIHTRPHDTNRGLAKCHLVHSFVGTF